MTLNAWLPTTMLYKEGVISTRYLAFMALAFLPTQKVILIEIYPQTYTGSPEKPTNEPLRDANAIDIPEAFQRCPSKRRWWNY